MPAQPVVPSPIPAEEDAVWEEDETGEDGASESSGG